MPMVHGQLGRCSPAPSGHHPPRGTRTGPSRPFLSDPRHHLSIQQPDVLGDSGLALPDVSSFPNTSGFPSGTLWLLFNTCFSSICEAQGLQAGRLRHVNPA